MKKSKALFFDGDGGNLRLALTPKPTIGQTDILVRVEATTICGSDVHTIHKRREVLVPTILGHEILGFVEEFGKLAPHFDSRGKEIQIGDRIVWGVVAHCGACAFCDSGLTQKCCNATKYGHEKATPGFEWTGGFAEWCVLAQGTTIIKVPFETPSELLCPASCATATVFSAIEAAGNLKGKSVLITGAGLLGATAILATMSMGAKDIFVVESIESRRKKALELGAKGAFSPDEIKMVKEIPSVNIFLELSGSNAAWEIGFRMLATGGVAVLVGSVFPSNDASINLEKVVRSMLTIRGIHNYRPNHLFQAVDFLVNCDLAFALAEMVGPWFSLEEHKYALETALRPETYRTGFKISAK